MSETNEMTEGGNDMVNDQQRLELVRLAVDDTVNNALPSSAEEIRALGLDRLRKVCLFSFFFVLSLGSILS